MKEILENISYFEIIPENILHLLTSMWIFGIIE